MQIQNILIHGYNVDDPEQTVGKLRAHLKHSYLFDYGHFNLAQVLMYNRREAMRLYHILIKHPNINIYAHSNGCAIALLAARMGAPIKNLVCINPALNIDAHFPDNIQNVIVVHTKHDKPVRAARLFDGLPLLGLLIPDIWGAMGAYGAMVNNPRVTNLDVSLFVFGHSEVFESQNITKVFPSVENLLIKKGV